MDVSGLLGALTGGVGNVKIDIILNTPSNDPYVVPMDHYPSWKLHKNPFWRVKHPQKSSSNMNTPTPVNNPSMMASGSMMQDPNLMYQQQQQLQHQQLLQQPNLMQPGMFPNNPNVTSPLMMPPQQQHQQFQQPPPPPSTMMMMHNQPPDLSMMGIHSQTSITNGIVAFESSRDISGVVRLRVPPGKKAEHLGIKVQFIGRIDMGQGVHEGRPHYDFVSLSKELAPPGVLYDALTEIPFLFKNMDKEHESYKGRNVAVRYFVKVALERKFLPPVSKEHDVWVQILGQEPAENEAIKMEVGIEDCLHIEFEYERRVFHLHDTIVGKIHFMLVRIKIKHMELAVIRRETSGEGVASSTLPGGGGAGSGGNSSRGAPAGSAVDVNNICTETQTLVKYEIMDGAPVKGEVIPVRLCLKGIPASLTPTYKAVNNRFSVRYFLNLVLVDAEDRRYFKQQEIILWRNQLG